MTLCMAVSDTVFLDRKLQREYVLANVREHGREFQDS